MNSANGTGVTGSFASGGFAIVCDQSYNTCNDALPQSYSMYASGSLLTFTFATPVSGIGTTIEEQGSIGNNVAATLSLYDGATLLGTVTESAPEFSQIYIGATTGTGDITSAVLGITGDLITNTTTTQVLTGYTTVNPTTTYVSFDPNKGDSDPNFCYGDFRSAASFGTPGSASWYSAVMQCPDTALKYGAYNWNAPLALPAGFCPAAAACANYDFTFQQGLTTPVYQTVTNTTTTPFQSSYQLDSLDIVDAPATAPSVTPEPSSLALLGTGVLSVAGFVRRRLVKSA
jgi:hypothetical protein